MALQQIVASINIKINIDKLPPLMTNDVGMQSLGGTTVCVYGVRSQRVGCWAGETSSPCLFPPVAL